MAAPTKSSDSKTRQNLDALYEHENQQAILRAANPLLKLDDSMGRKLRQEYFRSLVAQERSKRKLIFSVSSVRNGWRRLLNFLKPTNLILSAILFPFFLIELLAKFVAKQALNYVDYRRDIKSVQKKVAFGQNLDHLQSRLKNAGFTLNMEGPLTHMLERNKQEFSIRYHDPRFPKTDYNLHFSKIQGTKSYEFEKFTATARPDLNSFISKDSHALSHTFSRLDKDPYSASEASRLLDTRPVMRIIDGKETWQTLAGAMTKEGVYQLRTVSFDLENELKKLPIRDLNDPIQKEKTLEKLKQGYKTLVTVNTQKGPQKVKVSIGSFINKLDFFDKDGKSIDIKRLISGQTIPLNTRQLMEKKLNPGPAKDFKLGKRV